MLADISNRAQPAPSSPAALKIASTSAANNNKRPLPVSSESDSLLPSTFRLKRDLASTSSSSSPAPSSPYFQSTHLDAYNAPSSPSSLKPLTSPIHRFSTLPSLPPSSPSVAFSSSLPLGDVERIVGGSTNVAPRPFPSLSVNLDTLQTFHLERGLVLYFGRKAKKGIPRPSTDSSANVGAETFIPILLPKSAKNASRLHCSTRLLPAEDEDKVTVEIRVTGMNGMKIDGKLYRKGSVALSTVEPGQRMKLHFWGWDAQLVVAESEVSLDSDDGLSDGEDESRWRASSGEESDHDALPSSSSASKSRQHSLVASSSTSLPRASSPALSYLSDASSSSERNAAASAAFERADALMTSLNLDLPGLIASAIVFHPRATVAVDEITRALLRETGSLWKILGDDEAEVERKKETQEGEDEAVDAWREMVQEILTEEDMFGAIDNSGLKDAAGQPVASLFYYSPEQDRSRDRVAALEPFVKRVRGARAKGGVQYFFKRPSLKKNR